MEGEREGGEGGGVDALSPRSIFEVQQERLKAYAVLDGFVCLVVWFGLVCFGLVCCALCFTVTDWLLLFLFVCVCLCLFVCQAL